MNARPFNLKPFRRRRHIEEEELAFIFSNDLPKELFLQRLNQYRQHCLDDFMDIGRYVFWILQFRFGSHDYSKGRSLVLEDSTRSKACIEYNASSKKIITVISKGLYHALDDLFMNLVCDPDFIPNTSRISITTFDTKPYAAFQPYIRFYDYQMVQLNDLARGSSWVYTYISKYTSSLPRRNLADFMMQTVLAWIVAHEEAHFTEGHIDFAILNQSDDRGYFCLDECEAIKEKDIPSLQKVFEWQADRHATNAVLTIFFTQNNLTSPVFALINHEDRPALLLRTIISSTCVSTLIMQKMRNSKGRGLHLSHPAPQTRLYSIIECAVSDIFLGRLSARVLSPQVGAINFARIDNFLTYDAIRGIVAGVLSDLARCKDVLNAYYCEHPLANDSNPLTKIFLKELGRLRGSVNQTDEFGLLDSEIELEQVAEEIINRICLRCSIARPQDASDLREIDSAIHSHWFTEFDNEIQPFIAGVTAGLEAIKPKFF